MLIDHVTIAGKALAPLQARFEQVGLQTEYGGPVILATPTQEDGWLYQRLQRFGPLPCAFLVGATDMATSVGRYPLTTGESWLGRDVRWIDPGHIGELRLGFIES